MTPTAEPAPSPTRDLVLGSQAEGEWQRLRQQLEFADGFWLGFLFSPHPGVTRTFRRRTETFLRGRLLPLNPLVAETAEEIPDLLPQLFGVAESEDHPPLVWIEAAGVDLAGAGGRGPAPWARAWDDLLLRLNERRERLRRHLRHGLILVGHPDMKPRTRNAAPDLWSIRSLVLEPQPPTALSPYPGGLADKEQERNKDLTRPVPHDGSYAAHQRVAEAGEISERRARKLVREDRPPIELLRLAAADLDAGRVGDAIDRAAAAIEQLETAPEESEVDRAAVYALLAYAERIDGDPAAAADHMQRAVDLLPHRSDRRALLWLDFLGEMAESRGDNAERRRIREDLLARSRERNGLLDNAPEALRDLSISLDRAGDLYRDMGLLQEAREVYEESLALTRRLLEEIGDSPQALRDLSVSLHRAGDLYRNLGLLREAREAYEESLAISRRLLEEIGDSPQALRDLSVSLNRAGNLYRDLGLLQETQEAYEESFAITRRLLKEIGASPQALRDLSVSLDNAGDLYRDLGRLQEAREAYEESLAISRRLLEEIGDSPQALRDLSVSLARAGDLYRDLGFLQEARQAYDESRATRRRLLEKIGESPQALRDLSVSLENAGELYRDLGLLEEAREAYKESLALARRLLEEIGESPQVLRDLAVGLAHVGDLSRQEEPENALRSYLEAAGLLERVLELQEEVPRSRADLIFVLTRVAEAQEALGREDEAAATRARIEELGGELAEHGAA